MDTIDRINALIDEKRMSGAELARKIGVSNSALSQWNARTTKPSTRSLRKIADVLCTTVDYLTGETGKMQKENPTTVSSDGVDQDRELIYLFSQLTTAEKAMMILQIKGILSSR